jgi:hypothetical protein
MRVVGILVGFTVILLGLRIAIIGIMTAFSGKVLVRAGLRTRWEPAPSMEDAWRLAFRDAVMGILLIILGVAMLM